MGPQVFEAKNFLLSEAEVMSAPSATSSRDFRLTLKLPVYRDWGAGQFVMIRWGKHLIGRPFAIVDWYQRSSTPYSVLHLWIRRMGAGTEELFRELTEGSKVSVTLPLGVSLPAFQSEPRLLLVSGGVGAASLYPIMQARKKAGVGKDDLWIHGERDLASLDREWVSAEGKSAADLFYFDAFDEKEWKKLGLKNKKGFEGRVTAAFDGSLDERLLWPFSGVVSCGPTVMMEALGLRLRSHRAHSHLPIYLGLEEKMACGIGLCFSCSVSTAAGLKRCCTEGPWYELSDLKNHFAFRKTGQV